MSILTDIKHRHSAGSLNGFVDNPQIEIAKRIFGLKPAANDNMIRGNVSEHIARFILARDPDSETIRKYSVKKWKEYNGQSADAMMFALNCGKQFAQCLEERQLKRPQIYQEVFRDHIEGYDFPSIGYGDFTYTRIKLGSSRVLEDMTEPYLTVDLKSTARVPSSLDTVATNHIRQQSYYWGLSGKKRQFALLYASDKKYNYIEIPQSRLEEDWEIMLKNQRWIERIDSMCHSKQDWLDMFPFPDTNTFYYKDSGDFQQRIITLLKGEQNADN